MFDFALFFDAVLTTIRDAYPVIPTVGEYPRLRSKIPSPAILVELADLTPIEDPGTGEFAVSARFEARVVFDRAPTEPGQIPDMLCLALATDLGKTIYHAGRFGQPAGRARVGRIEPDRFKPDLAGYAVWLVEWTHEIRLGESAWDGRGVVPTTIYAGLAPEIGIPHEPDYVEVSGD